MSGDNIIDVARDLLAQQPSAELLDRELAAQLQLAETTQAQLRTDIRQLVSEYRVWRRAARCGMAATGVAPVNLPQLKQIRAGWATYRLTQLLLRDMREIAAFEVVQPVTLRLSPQPSVPQIAPLTDMPAPANDTALEPIDEILLEELEAKYGPALAQKLYEELKKAEEISRKG